MSEAKHDLTISILRNPYGWHADEQKRVRLEAANLIESLTAENARLREALKALMPEGWDDGTMDHMPGIAQARAALALAKEDKGLREALEKLTQIWSDYTSQEMYGEHLRAGISEIDFDTWTDAHAQARAALAKE